MHAGNDDEDADADGEHERHGHEALSCVEAAVCWGVVDGERVAL